MGNGRKLVLFSAALAALAWAIALLPEPVDEAEHCREMVAIWVESNGEFGWPPEVCDEH